MKRLSAALGLAGLVVLTVLVMHAGSGEVLALLGSAGWPLLWLLPFHVLPVLLDAIGWQCLLRPSDPLKRASLAYLFWVGTVRESVGRVLPTASIGGDLVAIRLACLRIPEGGVVAASVVLEILIGLLKLYLFVALAMLWLLQSTGTADLARDILLALGLSLPVLAVFGIALRYGALFARLQRLIAGMLGPSSEIARLIGGADIDAELVKLYRHRGRLLATFALQFAAIVAGAFETWLALRLLGHPVDVPSALALEALQQAIRHLVFVAPAGLGVQEVGLLMLGRLIGLPDEASLSLSLAKRARELLFAVLPLASWQWMEALRLKRPLPDAR